MTGMRMANDKRLVLVSGRAHPALAREVADELGIDVDTVRNYFGGKHYDAKGNVGIHVEQGPDGGVVTLDDTTILDAAMRILNQQ